MLDKMQTIVDKYVKHYKTDFDIDKKTMEEEPEGVFVWMLRDSGTQLLNVEDLKWFETAAHTEGKYWLYQTLKLYKVDLKNQTIKEMKTETFEKLLADVQPMDSKTKLIYIVKQLKRDTRPLHDAIRSAKESYHYNITVSPMYYVPDINEYAKAKLNEALKFNGLDTI